MVDALRIWEEELGGGKWRLEWEEGCEDDQRMMMMNHQDDDDGEILRMSIMVSERFQTRSKPRYRMPTYVPDKVLPFQSER